MKRSWIVGVVMLLWCAAATTLLFGPDAGQPGAFLPLAFGVAAVVILVAGVAFARQPAVDETGAVVPEVERPMKGLSAIPAQPTPAAQKPATTRFLTPTEKPAPMPAKVPVTAPAPNGSVAFGEAIRRRARVTKWAS